MLTNIAQRSMPLHCDVAEFGSGQLADVLAVGMYQLDEQTGQRRGMVHSSS